MGPRQAGLRRACGRARGHALLVVKRVRGVLLVEAHALRSDEGESVAPPGRGRSMQVDAGPGGEGEVGEDDVRGRWGRTTPTARTSAGSSARRWTTAATRSAPSGHSGPGEVDAAQLALRVAVVKLAEPPRRQRVPQLWILGWKTIGSPPTRDRPCSSARRTSPRACSPRRATGSGRRRAYRTRSPNGRARNAWAGAWRRRSRRGSRPPGGRPPRSLPAPPGSGRRG